MLVMLTELLSGLALFLFGMKFMSEGLQKAAGDKMRVILDRVTKNRFIGTVRWYYIWCQYWYDNYCTACFFETDCHCTVYHLCRCMPDDVWQ